MTASCNVLIPDGDSTWALSVIQCLSQVKGYNIYVLSNKKRTATKFSKFTSYYKFYDRPNDADWVTTINAEIEKNSIAVVLPIAEREFLFFINHGHQISTSAKIIALPNSQNFEIAIDKMRLSDFSNANGIPHPNSYFISSEKEKQDVLSNIQFPILVKPLGQKGGDGIQKIDTKSGLETYVNQNNQSVFIQEFIEGYDIDCSVLCQNGDILSYTIQKGNLKGHSNFAPQLAFDFLQNDDVLNVAKLIMSKLNWSGVAHIDMRYDKSTNDYKLIEINARFWGSVEGSMFAGINFPHKAVQLALNQELADEHYDNIHHMRFKGVLKSIKRNPLFIFRRKYIMNNTEAKTFLNDPLPTLYRFREWLGRRF
ncbi:ATP-grasp domain-containing protein [Psychroserpens damuponensis]|uniref:ATP-grasp domain-containing protein n=1 Tax=Psychroserpens damuponensis TaxID=943936 RepID=UPI00058DDBFE|nr:ATP-grasp domain-containing protein [Psychroserpens damuponensis]